MSGRIINEDISQSDKIGSLSPKSLALFCLIIPHFNAHGKMVGGPGYIKDLVCPKVKWLTAKAIINSLKEISEKTNVKWFKNNGLWYIHSLSWQHHQPGLRRLGPDKLPSYNDSLPDRSGTTPEPVPPEVEVEVEVEREVEVEGEKTKPLKADSPQPVDKSELKKQAVEVLEYLNQKTRRAYRPVDVNLDLIIARLKSKATPDQCREIIDLKCREWIGTDGEKWLRPATLFGKSKFEQYIGEIPSAKKKGKGPRPEVKKEAKPETEPHDPAVHKEIKEFLGSYDEKMKEIKD